MATVTVSLVSHTNVGKTTLARTLLRRDVGEVLDRAHVTEVSEAHVLIEKDQDRALLWDTPGFGDTNRLLRRLRKEQSPIGWFLHQVWDRVADRPLWCGQEAIRNVRQDADVVLYLVNASEDPEDAGYVSLEMELLGWLETPVLVLLNQTGESVGTSSALEDAWRRHLAPWPHVRGVQSLDAFRRCWVQEALLFQHLADSLEGEKRATMQRLARAWEERLQAEFHECTRLLASYLTRAALAREDLPRPLSSRAEKKRAMSRLARGLEATTEALMDSLFQVLGLEGHAAETVREEVEHFVIDGTPKVSVRKGALLGGVLSGALGGLAADVVAGGLTFGGGVVAGAILGALGGAGLARGMEILSGPRAPGVAWSTAFLEVLLEQTLLRYLAAAHHGRGRGGFEGNEAAEGWAQAIAQAREARRKPILALWALARARGPEARGAIEASLAREVGGILREVLAQAYPESAGVLE